MALSGLQSWSYEFQLTEGPSGNDDDDWLNNIGEFGLGGDPTDALDQGLPQTYEMTDWYGSNVLVYVYPMRHDPSSGLSYYLVTDTDLVAAPGWTNAGYWVEGIDVTGDTFDYVTNMVPMDTDQKFIKLIIEE